MGYFKQLQIKGVIPTRPFPELVDISHRAHYLLKDRTEEQINSAAACIDSWIEQFFEIARENEIERMREERLHEFFIFDGQEGDGGEILNGLWLFNDEMEDDLNCPSIANTSALDALREYADHMWDPILDEEVFHRTKDYEIYAVLALLLVQESSLILKEGYSLKDVEAAGRSSIAAMEAICYATQKCRDEEFSEEARQNAKADAEKIKIDLENETKNKRSKHSKLMNDSKNVKRNEAVTLVESEWSKNRNQFSSATRAGEHYSDWLNEKGYKYRDSTVTSWIRACAKKNDVKFR